MIKTTTLLKRWGITALALGISVLGQSAFASSHREAPLIAQDPQADNTDLYVFRSPDDTNTVTIIANYIPFQSPDGGPNYYTFGSNIRYEIHIKNNTATAGDDIVYRFTFTTTNEDPSTFFNIRNAGGGPKRNQRTTYSVTRITPANPFGTNIVVNGQVPSANIGPRSIHGPAGLNLPYTYDSLMRSSVATASTGEKIYAGPADDPFFVDLAGAFDLGGFRPLGNATNPTKDGLARYNVHSICIKVPITTLQKSNRPVTSALNILDEDFVIGVWASASRRETKTLRANVNDTVFGPYVQVSRLGMPLTNEVIVPIGYKDKWNALTASDAMNSQFLPFYKNPELALYMDTRPPGTYGGAVPALNALRIQTATRPDLIPGGFDFGNGRKGLWPLKGSPLLVGTAFDPATFGNLLLPDSVSPRSADIMPIFLTGVPNLPPYQLAVGKANVPSSTKMNPFAPGKPFINNFLPAVGDMLRLNMAVPVTQRNDPAFSSLGIIQAAVLGLTTAPYNTSNAMQWIPNMDGFPNGRRLEDDVTTIEMQAVGGVALAAIGLWFDDWAGGTASGVTPALVRNLSFTAGPTKNDTTFKASFPYVATPWRGYDYPYQQRF